VSDRLISNRIPNTRTDFGQRNEDESTLAEPRMGHRQLGSLNDALIIQEDVHVDRSRPPALRTRPPSNLVFETFEEMQQRFWLRAGLDPADRVKEGGLLFRPDGIRLVE